MLVSDGIRYCIVWPVFGSSRTTRSVCIVEAQSSPFLSKLARYGKVYCGRLYSVNFSVFVSNCATLLARYSVTRTRSCSSICMRRARACGVGVPRHFRRLRIDLAEMAFGEFGHPQVVLGVRHDLINAGILDARQLVGRMESLPLVGRQIEPENVLRADALGPHLAVDVVAQSREIQLHAVVVVFWRERIIGNLTGLRVQRAERALVHRVEPDLAGMVERDAEQPGGRLILEFPDRIL